MTENQQIRYSKRDHNKLESKADKITQNVARKEKEMENIKKY